MFTKKIVIAGGGSAGWMTAAMLSTAFRRNTEIILVESESIGTVGVGEATIPLIKTFNRALGIDENDFIKATQGTFKLGIQFENWGAIGDSYIHPFGQTGKDSWMANFQHFWIRANQEGLTKSYFDYCLNIRAAKENKFSKNPDAGFDYAYHFDASLYAKFLRKFSEEKGVIRKEGTIKTVKINKDSGHIDSLSLESGEKIDGTFFIDCTGFQALLINKALHTGFEDWSHWLPCDSAVAVQTAAVRPPAPYTRSIAHEFGWQWQIPLQHRVGNGLVYCSRYASDELATQKLLSNVQGELINTPRIIRFKTGRTIKAWNKNCVAIGLSGGFLEPLESTSLHLIHTGIERLVEMMPRADVEPKVIEEYNRQTKAEYEGIRDFIIAHYHVTQRSDSDFWNFCRNMDLPDKLAKKISIYKATTSVPIEPEELFRECSWQQIMLGQGLTPTSYHPIVDNFNSQQLMKFMASIDHQIDQILPQMPSHQEYIEQYCSAEK